MIGPIVLALVPIALLIGLGFLLHRRKFLPDVFWPGAERLSYFVLLPALLAHGLATADLTGVPVLGLAGALIPALLLVGGLLAFLAPALRLSGPAFTSVFQGGVRFNTYVGVAAVLGLYGASALPLAAVANATIVPTVNVMCVLVFARWGSGTASLRGILTSLATNPLVLGSLAGVLLQATGLGLPKGVEPFVRALGQASLPLGLLCVGAALDLKALGRGTVPALVACLFKFVALPLATALFAALLGLDARATAIAILFSALPTAASSYVMARQLGGDAPLVAGIVALQTLLAALSVPVALLLLAPA